MRQRRMMETHGLTDSVVARLVEEQRLARTYIPLLQERAASKLLASLEAVGNSPAFLRATRDVATSILKMVEQTQNESRIAKLLEEASGAWESKLRATAGLNGLSSSNILVGHLSRIADISLLTQTSLARLQPDLIGNALTQSERIRKGLTFRLSSLTSAYSDLYALIERSQGGVLSLPPDLSALPPVEIFNAVDLLNRTTNREADDEGEYNDEIDELREGLSLETQESLEGLLIELNKDLLALWNGAKQALQSNNPDRVRHFMVSFRELFTHVLHNLAPDDQIRAWSTDKAHYANNRPTRNARLQYICREVNQAPFTKFVHRDIEAVLEFINLFQGGTHQVKTSYTQAQLAALVARMEGAILFLLSITKATH